jgi:hypothetical protein
MVSEMLSRKFCVCSHQRVSKIICPLTFVLTASIFGSLFYGIYYIWKIIPFNEYSRRLIPGEIQLIKHYSYNENSDTISFSEFDVFASGFAEITGTNHTIRNQCKTYSYPWYDIRYLTEQSDCQECLLCFTPEKEKEFGVKCSREARDRCIRGNRNRCVGDILQKSKLRLKGFTNIYNPCDEFYITKEDTPTIESVPYDKDSNLNLLPIFGYSFGGIAAILLLCLLSVYTANSFYNVLIVYDVPYIRWIQCQEEYPRMRRCLMCICSSWIVDFREKIPTTPTAPTAPPVEEIIENPMNSSDIHKLSKNKQMHYKRLLKERYYPRMIDEEESSLCFLTEKPIQGLYYHCSSCHVNVNFIPAFLSVLSRNQCPKCEKSLDFKTELQENIYGYVKYD